MKRINILVIDDEALVREGLCSLLRKEDFIRDVYEASGVSDCYDKLAVHQIDVVLLDIRLKNSSGMDILLNLKKKKVPPAVIAFTALEGIEVVVGLLKAGIDGIVHKFDGYAAIRRAIIEIIVSGKKYFPEGVTKIIEATTANWDSVPPITLSFHERDLLKAIAKGYTTKEISVHMKMAEATAETYRVRLIRKLNVGNTAGLLAYAYRNGML